MRNESRAQYAWLSAESFADHFFAGSTSIAGSSVGPLFTVTAIGVVLSLAYSTASTLGPL